ncbi:MAG TPA: glucose-6-phosphate dehydrogenase, partial [Acidobacteriota bacterium]|nr:glucose-6-phosphate dehydrogenase [Acidobacteriota bacterium]
LAKRKLMPAFCSLIRRDMLTPCTPIVCVGRRPLTKEQFIEHLELPRFIPDLRREHLEALAGRIEYLQVDLAAIKPEAFKRAIMDIRKSHGCSLNMMYYFALSPELFLPAAGLIQPLKRLGGFKRVAFEKPFGADLASAAALNTTISNTFSEQEIYRVDHYLVKELVRNIIVFRFANPFIEKLWNAEDIDNIQITAFEELGVEMRAGYYDNTGALRDMIQNHLLHVLSFAAMDAPSSLEADDVRDKTAEVMNGIRMPREEDVLIGQYRRGMIHDTAVPGYQEEKGVEHGSTTETFAAVRLFLDTRRWQGIPFYIRTGKRLRKRFAEIKIIFRETSKLFRAGTKSEPGMIVIRIHPEEGIAICLNVKHPGEAMDVTPVMMDFCHACSFGPNTPEAYEHLLLQIMKGDPTLFTRWDWLESSWRYIDALRAVSGKPLPYAAGSMGPDEAEAFPAADGRRWL